MSLCLLAGGTSLRVALAAFTLAWTHSVEGTRWEEDWRVEPAGLVLVEARIEGLGAGMEPPPGARFTERAWRWRPDLPALSRIVLRRSGAAPDWGLCAEGACRPLGEGLPAGADPVALRPCPD